MFCWTLTGSLPPLTLCEMCLPVFHIHVAFWVLLSPLHSLSLLSNPFFSFPLVHVPNLKYPWMVSPSAPLLQYPSYCVVHGSAWQWSWGTVKHHWPSWRVSRMPNPCTVWIPDAPLPRWGVRLCWVASRSLWTRQSLKRILLSVLAPSCWLLTASARRHQSTWGRLGLSLPQQDPPRNTPCTCLLPHLTSADTRPQLCWTRASRLNP